MFYFIFLTFYEMTVLKVHCHVLALYRVSCLRVVIRDFCHSVHIIIIP